MGVIKCNIFYRLYSNGHCSVISFNIIILINIINKKNVTYIICYIFYFFNEYSLYLQLLYSLLLASHQFFFHLTANTVRFLPCQLQLH